MEKATFEIIRFDRNDFLTASSDGFVDGGAGGEGGSSGSGSSSGGTSFINVFEG